MLWSLLMLKQTSSLAATPKNCYVKLPQVHGVIVASNCKVWVISIGNLFSITKLT